MGPGPRYFGQSTGFLHHLWAKSPRGQLLSFGGNLLHLAGGRAASRRMSRGRPRRCGECEVCIDPKRQRKEKCMANVPAELSSPSPPPPSSRQCKAPEKYEPSEEIRSRCQEDGRRWKPSAIAPSPSPPQQPRPMTSLQLWLNKPKIDQRVQELERPRQRPLRWYRRRREGHHQCRADVGHA